MHTRLLASFVVLGVVSSEGDVVPPYFFETGFRLNANIYIEVLKDIVKRLMDSKANRRDYVFQKDIAPTYKAKITQAEVNKVFHDTINAVKIAVVEVISHTTPSRPVAHSGSV